MVWKLKLRSLEFIQLSIYFVCFLMFYDIAELTTDDGQWSGRALDLIKGNSIPWQIPASVSGTFHTSLGSYLLAIPLFLYESHLSIIIFVFICWLLSHYYILKLDRLPGIKIGSRAFSAFLFFMPIMFIFALQKSWQTVFLPMTQVLSLFYFLTFFSSQRGRDLYLSFFLLGLCVHFHLSAICLFPIFLGLLIILKQSHKLKLKNFLICESLLYLTSFPILIFMSFKIHFLFIFFLVIMIVIFKTFNHKENLHPVFFNKRLYLVSLSFIILLSYLITSFENMMGPLRTFAHLLPSNNFYLANRSSLASSIPLLHEFISLEILMLVITTIFMRLKVKLDLVIYLILFSIFCGVILLGPILQRQYMPHQWFLFTVPYTHLAIVYFVSTFSNLRFKEIVISILILSNFLFSLRFATLIKKYKTTGFRLSSYGVKKEILDSIYKKHANPAIEFQNTDYWGVVGWKYLQRYYTKDTSQPTKRFIVLIDDYKQKKLTQKDLETYSSFKKLKVGNHYVFEQK